MDTTRYDLSRLDREELFEYRALQGKLRAVHSDLDRLTLEELVRLDLLFLKMANEPYSWERLSVYADENGKLRYKDNGDPYMWESEKRVRCHYCGHVLASGAATRKNDSVPDVFCSEQCLESMQAYYETRGHRTPSMNPPAIAPAAAPAKPVAPATPAQPEKPKRSAEDIMSAHRQLDALMRFGA